MTTMTTTTHTPSGAVMHADDPHPVGCSDAPRRLADDTLLARLRALVVRSNETEAELLAHLGEVDERRLYLPEHTSLFVFCTAELGFSEAAAEHRIAVARAARRFPRMLELLSRGRIHLSGLRVLVPHLTEQGAQTLLEQAAGKSKRSIEELVARLAPRPEVADSIRKLPERPVAGAAPGAAAEPLPLLDAPSLSLDGSAAVPPRRPASIAPLAPERYHVQLTASRRLRDKIDRAQALLRQKVPSGDLATILERALDLLIAEVEKQRFGVGRKPRSSKLPEGPATSRTVPAALKRAVFTPSGGVMHPERDGGQCTFVGPSGRRCQERGFVQIDHVDGFARRAEHTLDGLRLLCPAHNQHAADVMYGRDFMASKRKQRARPTHPGDGRDGPDGSGSETTSPSASTVLLVEAAGAVTDHAKRRDVFGSKGIDEDRRV